MRIKRIKIDICEACLKGQGAECHTPGCALFLHRVDIPFTDGTYEVLEEFCGDIPRAFHWDWKEHPPIQAMLEAARELPEYVSHEVDTQSDECGVVIGPKDWTKERVREFWEVNTYADFEVTRKN